MYPVFIVCDEKVKVDTCHVVVICNNNSINLNKYRLKYLIILKSAVSFTFKKIHKTPLLEFLINYSIID